MIDEMVQPREEQSFRLTGEIDGSRLTYDLTTGELIIGASEDCDVQMVATGVSRRHAMLTIGNGTLTVRDLDSKNGTFVNGRKIRERTVDEGDWIGFGPVVRSSTTLSSLRWKTRSDPVWRKRVRPPP